jgi:hypothetical protein
LGGKTGPFEKVTRKLPPFVGRKKSITPQDTSLGFEEDEIQEASSAGTKTEEAGW